MTEFVTILSPRRRLTERKERKIEGLGTDVHTPYFPATGVRRSGGGCERRAVGEEGRRACTDFVSKLGTRPSTLVNNQTFASQNELYQGFSNSFERPHVLVATARSVSASGPVYSTEEKLAQRPWRIIQVLSGGRPDVDL